MARVICARSGILGHHGGALPARERFCRAAAPAYCLLASAAFSCPRICECTERNPRVNESQINASVISLQSAPYMGAYIYRAYIQAPPDL